MNYFVKDILKKYKDGKEACFISDIKENHKFNIEFKKDENDNENMMKIMKMMKMIKTVKIKIKI